MFSLYTCRSPMAVAIAQKIAKGVFDSESRGIYPYGNSATDDAIDVMRSEFDIDISSHQPRGLEGLQLDKFDYVVAMNPEVAKFLMQEHTIEQSRLITWKIRDPYLEGRDDYKRCANEILTHVRDLVTFLSTRSFKPRELDLDSTPYLQPFKRHTVFVASSRSFMRQKKMKRQLRRCGVCECSLSRLVLSQVSARHREFLVWRPCT